MARVIGQRLRHYKILDKLGAGGMGEVYRAEDTTLKRQVALKVLPADLASSEERLERFQREAETLAALDHPNIVTVFSVEHAEGVHFLTMQLVEGKRLSELIPQGGMTLERIFETAIPLADALAAAHGKGVIHRDLKPDNIMVTQEGRVKVLDFGLAKLRAEAKPEDATALATEPLTVEGRIAGTVPYMSPEQLEGKEIDARSDIFSLGVVLYEMATGERPFAGDTSVSLISSIVKDKPRAVDAMREELPHHLGRVISRCLEKHPKRRYQAAIDVHNELDGLRKELDSGGVAPSPVGEQMVGLPRRRRWWPLAAGLAVVLIALVAVWFGRRPAPSREAAPAPGETPMIVVLPFENLGSPEDEYFADGMSEEITSRLAMVRGLGVISRTSAMQYKESRPPLRQIGDELGVDYVLEGTVRWAKSPEGPGRVRVTPQLIRVADDRHLWADNIERELEDIFEVQSEIAERVITELGVTLLGGEKEALAERPTDSVPAYEAYLRGIWAWHGLEAEEASRLFASAVELDPQFIEAKAYLARAYALRHFWGDASEDWVGMAAAILENLERDAPDHPAVRQARGMYLYYGLRDYESALEVLEQLASEQPSNTDAIRGAGFVLNRMGRWEEAIAAFERALTLDPQNPHALVALATSLRNQGEFERADTVYRRCIEVAPELSPCYWRRSWNMLLWTGDIAAAREIGESGPDDFWKEFLLARLDDLDGKYEAAIERADRLDAPLFALRIRASMPYAAGDLERARAAARELVPRLEEHLEDLPSEFMSMSVLAMLYAILGQEERALRTGERAIELGRRDQHEGPFTWSMLAETCLILGDHERAIDLVDRVLATPHFDRPSHHFYRLDPLWEPLRDDPRFQALLEKYG